MLILNIHHSAAENEAVFINIVGPLLACILIYFYKRNKKKNDTNTESDLSTEGIRFTAKIGTYIFGILFFLAFLVGVYKGIKFCFD